MTTIICYGINAIPGLHLRASEQAELLGMDDDQLGEFAYDYVEVRRDYLAWTPAKEYHNQDSPVAGELPTQASVAGSISEKRD
jgi:Amt family ammonium transporter